MNSSIGGGDPGSRLPAARRPGARNPSRAMATVRRRAFSADQTTPIAA